MIADINTISIRPHKVMVEAPDDFDAQLGFIGRIHTLGSTRELPLSRMIPAMGRNAA
ncbi:MAG: hypothetical protein ACK5II_04425 [Paracoccus sp. (in: a-proteobacteria)]